ncbi:hypothetical protein [Streptomyces sp. bgisy027]|uniref:hypothetical protein n=1 Tax=Streptomyces sp. bgisy027 TaxID=3413770 RepID=UPI003D70567D
MSTRTQLPATAPRRIELDALRVFVVLGLVFFRSAPVLLPLGPRLLAGRPVFFLFG